MIMNRHARFVYTYNYPFFDYKTCPRQLAGLRFVCDSEFNKSTSIAKVEFVTDIGALNKFGIDNGNPLSKR